jgi:CheY-like chemotaxis protein
MDGARVLIVDDEVEILGALASLLEDEGFDVSTARSGAEALDRVRLEGRPDVALVDLMMPAMTGWELCRELRRDPRTEGTPVVIMTAAPSGAASGGGCEHRALVHKPFDVDRLIEVLRRCCVG